MFYSKKRYNVKEVLKKQIGIYHDNKNFKMFSSLFAIEDKAIGLNVPEIKLRSAYDFINKNFPECEDKYTILNYLVGEIK